MIEYLNKTLDKYFALVASVGYLNYSTVYDILFLIAVVEFAYSDVESLLTDKDYKSIQNAIYKVFGTHCILPFPKHCCCMDSLHLSDVSHLSQDVKYLKDRMEQVENTKVVKTKANDPAYEMDDITVKQP